MNNLSEPELINVQTLKYSLKMNPSSFAIIAEIKFEETNVIKLMVNLKYYRKIVKHIGILIYHTASIKEVL